MSGYDKIIEATRAAYLMAPKIESQKNQFTKVTLYSKVDLDMMTKEDSILIFYGKERVPFGTLTSDSYWVILTSEVFPRKPSFPPNCF